MISEASCYAYQYEKSVAKNIALVDLH